MEIIFRWRRNENGLIYFMIVDNVEIELLGVNSDMDDIKNEVIRILKDEYNCFFNIDDINFIW